MVEKNVEENVEESIDYRRKAERDMEDIGVREGALQSGLIGQDNIIGKLKEDLMIDILGRLGEAGVDVNDVESVRAFLDKLEARDPDLRELFEIAMVALMPDSVGDGEGEGVPGAGEGVPGAGEGVPGAGVVSPAGVPPGAGLPAEVPPGVPPVESRI